ncbi:MAG: ATP synthase subunit I [Lautropia sp.]
MIGAAYAEYAEYAGYAMAAIAGTIAGAAIGAAYFGLLARDVARLPDAKRPALMMAAGLIARMALAAAGFLVVAKLGGLPALAGALAGFVVARRQAIRARAATPVRAPRHRPQEARPTGPRP